MRASEQIVCEISDSKFWKNWAVKTIEKHVSSDQNLGFLGPVGDEILASYIGFIS